MAANSRSNVPLLLTQAPMFQSSSGYCRHLRFGVDATGACSVQDQEESRLRSANRLTFIMQYHSPLVHASARFSWYRAAMSGSRRTWSFIRMPITYHKTMLACGMKRSSVLSEPKLGRVAIVLQLNWSDGEDCSGRIILQYFFLAKTTFRSKRMQYNQRHLHWIARIKFRFLYLCHSSSPAFFRTRLNK